MGKTEKRFRVGLSFPGERRDYVKELAGYLADRLRGERIFFDEYYEAELARPDLDSYLQEIYREECELLVVFLCEEYKENEWCGLEWRAIRDLIKCRRNDSIMLIRLDGVDIADIEGLHSIDGCVTVDGRSAEEIAALVLKRAQNDQSPVTPSIKLEPQQRQHEETWLKDLRHRRFSGLESLYTPLEGEERRHRSLSPLLPAELMPTTMVFQSCRGEDGEQGQVADRICHDILELFRKLDDRPLRRLAVLGEPGAGKTFSLARIALEHAERALSDPRAPIPLYLPLGQWTEEGQPLNAFIEKSLGCLGPYFPALMEQRRALLLLDALNEIPTRQRTEKITQVRRLLGDERIVSSVITCRERDFQGELSLPMDTLTIQPLKPGQVKSFLHNYFCQRDPEEGELQAEALFWQMAGGEGVREAWLAWEKEERDFDSFWSSEEKPEGFAWRHEWAREQARLDRRSLLRLAENPYLLLMIAELFQMSGGRGLPDNRARLFADFVHNLCEREVKNRRKRQDGFPDPAEVQHSLEEIARIMQQTGGVDQQGNVQTALPRTALPSHIPDAHIHFALDASLLAGEGELLRFPHQLLQEYFAALGLKRDIAARGLPAGDLWPARTWWQRTGWEVVVELLAEFSASVAETERLVAWIARANPEVAADVWCSQGMPNLEPGTLQAIEQQWAPRLTDLEKEPQPPARAAIGRALARFGLDRRKGIGLRPDGLPDIDWVEIPGGAFIYQKEQRLELPTFYIARYPVTNAQYRAFIEDGGYENGAWWKGLARRIEAPAEPEWDEENHPRETVSWYEAVAFTRWLSERLGYAISLPTEQQWEKAARGADGLEYPWGDGYREGYANINETTSNAGSYYLRRTSPAGAYPQGVSSRGVHDLAGNVWEWCLNEYRNPENIEVAGSGPRVLRGGGWSNYPDLARAAYRSYHYPDFRHYLRGFRLCCAHPIG